MKLCTHISKAMNNLQTATVAVRQQVSGCRCRVPMQLSRYKLSDRFIIAVVVTRRWFRLIVVNTLRAISRSTRIADRSIISFYLFFFSNLRFPYPEFCTRSMQCGRLPLRYSRAYSFIRIQVHTSKCSTPRINWTYVAAILCPVFLFEKVSDRSLGSLGSNSSSDVYNWNFTFLDWWLNEIFESTSLSLYTYDTYV